MGYHRRCSWRRPKFNGQIAGLRILCFKSHVSPAINPSRTWLAAVIEVQSWPAMGSKSVKQESPKQSWTTSIDQDF